MSRAFTDASICGKERENVSSSLPLSLMSKPSVACAGAGRRARRHANIDDVQTPNEVGPHGIQNSALIKVTVN